MAVTLYVNAIPFNYPSANDIGWGAQATAWATAISQATLQKNGGTFTLTAEVDFGPNHGLKAFYFKSRAAFPGSTGPIRLGNNEGITTRNADNSADIELKINGVNKLQFGSSALSEAEFSYIQGLRSSVQTQIDNLIVDNLPTPNTLPNSLTVVSGTTVQYGIMVVNSSKVVTVQNDALLVVQNKLQLTDTSSLVITGDGVVKIL